MKTIEIKAGSDATTLALALIEEGGSDEIRPTQEVEKIAFGWFEKQGKKLGLKQVSDTTIALAHKRGLTLYTFTFPVKFTIER